MKRKSKVFSGVFAGALALTLISMAAVFGQERQVVVQRETVVQGPGGPDGTPPPDRTFVFVSSEMNFDGKLVKGAPYSAQAVTETTQTLSDGNRIVNKSAAAVYRDSEGRTRREQTLRAIGPFATAGEAPQTIFINDPVAGVNYALDSRSMVARKMSPMTFEFKFEKGPDGARPGVGSPKTPMPDRIEMHPDIFMPTPPPPPGTEGSNFVVQWHGGPEKRGKTESLGKQTIEGVEAEGTRNVTTIPAGEIGNERAIEIVFERWYSPELQTVVMTRNTDPRFGETSYRLTNISRDEPARSLFEVPPGYTVKEAPTPPAPPKPISGGVLNGKAINMPAPEYPAIAKQANASGPVTVHVTVDEYGNVISATAVSGHPLLRATAVSAARQAKFSPTKLSGQGVKISGVLVYTFGEPQ
jgi:TonB family protein